MTTRTEHTAAQEKAATTKRRSRQHVEVRHVQPVRPERSAFPSSVDGTRKFRAAEEAYESAMFAYAAESGAPADLTDLAAIEAFFNDRDGQPLVPVLDAEASGVAPKLAPEETARRKRRQVEAADHEAQKASTAKPPRRTRSARNAAEKKTPAKRPAPKAKEQPAKSTRPGKAPAVGIPEGFKSWADPKLATAVVRMKTKEGKSIKEIAEALRLPAVHRSWFLVSKVWRETADAKGIDRPRLSADAIEARKAKRAK